MPMAGPIKLLEGPMPCYQLDSFVLNWIWIVLLALGCVVYWVFVKTKSEFCPLESCLCIIVYVRLVFLLVLASLRSIYSEADCFLFYTILKNSVGKCFEL